MGQSIAPFISKGVFPVDSWTALLYVASTMASYSVQSALCTGEDAQCGLHRPVDSLRLSVGLWVVGGAHFELRAHRLPQFGPHSR